MGTASKPSGSKHGLRNKAIAVVVAIALVGWIGYALLRRETRAEAGQHLVEAALASDGARMDQYVNEPERQELGLSRRTLASYVHLILSPAIHDFRRSGAMQIEQDEMYTTVTQPLVSPDGRRTELSFVILDSADGPRASGLVAGLFVSSAMAGWPSDAALPNGKRKAKFWADALEQWMPRLTETGVPGVVIGTKPTMKKFSWAEYRDYLRERSE